MCISYVHVLINFGITDSTTDHVCITDDQYQIKKQLK